MVHRRAIAVLAVAAMLCTAFVAATGSAAGALAPELRRYPYITDLVGNSVAFNWMTDRSSTVGTVTYGPVDGGGNCTLTDTASASRIAITINSVPIYQWKAVVDLGAPGTYCYRPLLNGADLLQADPSPTFRTQVPAGSTEPFSFAVMGDWGQVDANGVNPDQANVIALMKASGARFAVTAGDNAYPDGSQQAYGDLQTTGADTSAVFGPSFWGSPGQLALFPAVGNHGLARSDAFHPQLMNFPEDVAVATSGGTYAKETACCVNGTFSQIQASAWYAFDAGSARFYVLDAAWPDMNPGTASPYENDAATHWTPGTPEYDWLSADLTAHPGVMKFAFWHYPLYADQTTERSDTFLQGSSSLEGMLAANNVVMGFNGHAHIYERNLPNGPDSLVTYVTGGGGGYTQSIGSVGGVGCSPVDAYGIGYSTNGSACGAASPPASASEVRHFLLVSVDGAHVTVTPINSLGQTFDAVTYDFSATPPDTIIDSSPPAFTASTSATVAFHSPNAAAGFRCSLDGGPAAPCVASVTYSGLSEGPHHVTVQAVTHNGGPDPTPATAAWTVDTTAPVGPDHLSAVAPAAGRVDLHWSAASDANGIASYDVVRDGVAITSVAGSTTSYSDTTAVPGSTPTYQVDARDPAGNVSSPSPGATVTVPSGVAPVFADGFESGRLSAWNPTRGIGVQPFVVHDGRFAAIAATLNGRTYARHELPAPYTEGFLRAYVDVAFPLTTTPLLHELDASGRSIGSVFVTPRRQLGFHDDVTGADYLSSRTLPFGWHALELRLAVGASGSASVWLDGVPVPDLSVSADLGTSPVHAIEIGDEQAGTWRSPAAWLTFYDDVAFATGFIGT
jgi:hypothetical protein